MSKVCIQFGCGLSAPKSWVNFDRSPRLMLEKSIIFPLLAVAGVKRLFPQNVKCGDIVSGLPVECGTVDLIYSSHVLEHLSYQDAGLALRNCFSLLKPGGKLKIVVPDLRARVDAYQISESANAADDFMHSCLLGVYEIDRSLMGTLRSIFGSAEHRWMYDARSLTSLLEKAGFSEVIESGYHLSTEVQFREVEDESRFSNAGYPELCLEATR